MFMKKIRLLLLISMIMPLIAGCWNRIEINDIGIVTAIGLDLMPNNRLRLSIQVGIPAKLGSSASGTGGGDKGRSTFVISETGETISDAYRNLQKKISRRIFFAHSRDLIIGEKLAKDGVSHIIDFFARYHEPRMRSYLVCTKGEASDLLNSNALLEKIPSEETRELNKQGIGLKVTIKDFWDMMLSDGIEPVAPQFQMEPREIKLNTDSKTANPSDQNTQVISGSAVFKKDKLVGWMSDLETRGILYLRNELSTGIITVNLPKDKGGKVSVQIVSVQSDIKPKLEGDRLSIEVQIRTEADVIENVSKINLGQSKMINYLQLKLNEEIKNRVQLALDIAQKKYRSDILGFGRAVYRAYPKQWNQQFKQSWDQTFPELEVSIKPNVVIRRIGLVKETGG